MEEDDSIRKSKDDELNENSSKDENLKNLEDIIARLREKNEALKKLVDELKKKSDDDMNDDLKST